MNVIGYKDTARDFNNSGISSLNTFGVGNIGLEAENAYEWNQLDDEYNDNLTLQQEGELIDEELNSGLESFSNKVGPGMSPLHGIGSYLVEATLGLFAEKKYTGKEGKKTNLASQAVDINTRDALQINIQSRQKELMETEGQWLPLIQEAKSYLLNKLNLLKLQMQIDESFKQNPTLKDNPLVLEYLKLKDQINLLDLTLKEAAATNPYLTDIFYGDAVDPDHSPLTYGTGKVEASRIRSALADGKLSHYWLNLSWTQNNNETELSGNVAQSLLDIKLSKLELKIADAQSKFEDKSDELKQKQFSLKTAHRLHDPLLGIVPLPVIYDPENIDPVLDQARNQELISITDPSSYKYGILHLGSSASEILAMAAQVIIGGAIKYGSKIAGTGTGPAAPLVWATGEAAASLISTAYFRHKETAAEVMSNYSEKVATAALNGDFDINTVMQDYSTLLKTMGYDTNKMDELEVLLFGLAYDLKTKDKNYNEFAKNARSGLTKLEEVNNALSLSDYAQNFGLSYGGKLVKDAVGFKAVFKGAANLANKNKKTARILKTVGNKIDKAVDKVLASPASKMVAKRVTDTGTDLALRLGKNWIAESTEEGIQGLIGREYQNTPVNFYDPERKEDYNLFRGALKAADLAIESNMAYYGVHWNDLYNTDEQLKREMEIGGFIGTLMGSAANAPILNDLRKQLKADKYIQAIAAEGFDNAETSYKTAQFLDAYRKGNQPDRMRNSLETFKKFKSPEVTDKMIDDDIELSNLIYGLYKSKAIQQNLTDMNIDKKKDKSFELFVLNAVNVKKRLDDGIESVLLADKTLKGTILSLLTNEDSNPLNTFVDLEYEKYKKQARDKTISKLDFKTPIINAIITRTNNKVLKQLKKDLKERKLTLQDIQKKYGMNVSTSGIEGMLLFIEDSLKSTDDLQKLYDTAMFKGTLNKVEDPTNIEEIEKQIAVSILNQGIARSLRARSLAYFTGRLSTSDRYMVEQKPLFSTLNYESKKSILTQYAEKYKQKHNTDKEPTEKQVISFYNMEVNQQWNSLDEKADTENTERFLANSLIQQDLSKSFAELDQAKSEINEETGVELANNDETIEEKATEEEVTTPSETAEDTTITETVEKDNNTGKSKEETSLESTVSANEVSDESDRNNANTPIDKVTSEDTSGSIVETNDTDIGAKQEVEINDIDTLLDEVAENGFTDTGEDSDVDVEVSNAEEASRVDTVEDDNIDELKAKYDSIEEGEPLVSLDDTDIIEDTEVNPGDMQEDSATTSEEPTVEEQREQTETKQLKESEVEKPRTTKEEQGSVTILVESFDGSNDEEVEVPIEDPSTIVYSDGTDTWVGNEDPSLGVEVPELDLTMLNTFEEVDAVDMGTTEEAAVYLGQTDKSPGLDTKKKVETNRIHSTFFFLPTATEPMPIVVNGKPIIFDGERRSGSELAEKLVIPGWLSKLKTYYVVTDSEQTRKGESDAVDRMAVHLIVEEDVDGKKYIYNTSLYEPAKARTKISKWGVSKEQQNTEIRKLKELRKSIIDKYISTYAPTYFTDPKTTLPQKAPKGVTPVGLRLSNGSINNQEQNKRPIYRPLTTVLEFGLSKDPLEMSKLILDGEVEFGFGKGPFPLDTEDRFAIMHFDNFTRATAQGIGYAGKIYIIPKVRNTPSQRNSAPIMLAEKRHFIPGGSKNLVTSYTPNGKAKYDDQGKRIPLSSAELIFRLLTYTLPISNKPVFQDVLKILCNSGPSTVTVGDTRVDKLSFYVRKTLYNYTNKNGEQMLMYGSRTPEGQYVVKYLKIRDANDNIVFTDELANYVIRLLSNNLHWSTDKEAMLQPISRNIVDAAIEYMNLYNTNYYRVLNCNDMVFTMEDLNLERVNGKVIRKSNDTPILMSWMINHEVLKTDVGEHAFKAPFVYADDAAVAETAELAPTDTEGKKPLNTKVEKKVVKLKDQAKLEVVVEEEKKLISKDKALTYDETVAMGLTPKQGFTYVLKADGSTVILPNSSKVLKKLIGNPNGVYSTERGTGLVDIKQAKQWLFDKLGIDSSDVLVTSAVMKAVDAPEVYGLLQSSFDRILNEFKPLIVLSTKSGKGIEYHEAWHYVSLLVLDDASRNQVYSDFIKRNPLYKDYTKKELEEVLAEEFRSYMLKETNTTLGYRMLKFFKTILKLVSIFSKRKFNMYSIVFDSIRKGNFKNTKLSQDTLEEFKANNPSGVYYYAPGISDVELKKVPHITNASTMYNIIESLSSTALSILNISNIEDVKNLKLDSVFDTIQYMYDSGEYDGRESNKLVIEDVLLNKDIFANQIRQFLQELGIRSIEEEQTRITEEEAIQNGDTYDNIWDRASYEISKKANTAFNAKLFFYSLPQSRFVLDQNGIQLLDSVKDSIFGLDLVQPFDVTWNKVLDNLWQSNDWPDLVKKVRNLAKADPFFARLLEKIDNPNYPLPENTITLLLTTILSAKNSMDTISIQPDESSLTVNKALGRKVWSVLDSNTLRKIARLPGNWSLNFMVSSMIETDYNNRSIISNVLFLKLRKLDSKILNNIKLITTKKDVSDRVKLFLEVKNDFLDLVNMIGIPFDNDSLTYLLNKIRPKDTNSIPGLEAFIALYTSKDKKRVGSSDRLIGSISNSVIPNIQLMKDRKSLEVTFKKQNISGSRIFNYRNPNAVINLMAVAYGETHPTPEEFSVTGADGSLLYPITLNNYMSDQLRWLNTNAYDKLTNLSNAAYSKNSLIVKTLSENRGVKLKLHTLIAVNEAEYSTSRDYFGISPLEDYITKMVLAEEGRLILPTMSDKKTWYSIEGVNIPKDFLTSVDYVTNESDEIVSVSKKRRFSSNSDGTGTLDIFFGYFLDEYNSIVNYYNTKQEVEKSKSRYYDNYHGKIGKDGRMKPGGNGGRFRYFNQLPINGEMVSLNRLLTQAEETVDQAIINNTLDNIKRLFIDDKENTYNILNDLLLGVVDNEIEQAIKLGVIGRNKEGQLTYGNLPSLNEMESSDESNNSNPFVRYKLMAKGISNKVTKREDVIYSIIANYVTSYAISIEELEKCFVGDPAMYKWKSNSEVGIFQRDVDKIKRLSSVLSTGNNLRTYWGENDPRNSTKFVSAIMQDNMIGSEYHHQLELIFKASFVRTMLKKNNPDYTDNELFELTDSEDKISDILNNGDILSEEDVKFIEKQSEKAASPYAFDDEENSGNINQADAAVYIRPDFYKKIMQSLGQWSDEIEEAYNILESDGIVDPETGKLRTPLNDPELYSKALKASIKPLKMMYFGDHFDGVSGINVPIFDKMAMFPMFKILAKADNKYLYDRMNNKELGVIDMLKFESSAKVGSTRDKFRPYKDNKNTQFNIEDLNKPSSIIVSEDDSVTERIQDGLTTRVLDLKQLRLQLNTEPHEATDRSFGTQAVKIGMGNVVDDRTYGSNKGKSVTGKQIKDDIFGTIKALSTKGYSKVLNRFFDKDGRINNRALSNYLVKEAKGTNMSMEIIEALKLNKNGQFIAPIASLSVRNWIESKIISLINKEVIDVNTPGGSAIQMSSFGFRTQNVWSEEDARPFNDGKKLSFDPSRGSMEVILSTNFFRSVVPAEFLTDYNAIRNWLIEHNVIGNESKPYGVGYRIPTQGLSSTFSFIVADVLPELTGDTIVVPDEFTAMTGSDFDIDKLYIATYSYDPSTNERYQWEGESTAYDKLSEGALVNKLLDSYTLVISDEKTLSETRASIDTLTGILKKDILPKVSTTVIQEAKPMYELTPSFLESRKTEYTSGKAGIAPFALNSTNHCLTQGVHLTMNYSKVAAKYGLGALDEIDGQDHYKILDWLSAMINAHVDVAKDPYIITLNVNQVTYNMTNLLLRAGKGKLTFFFLAQPAIKDFANRKIMNNGVIGVDQQFDDAIIKSIKHKYQKMLEPYEDKITKELNKQIESGSDLAFTEKDLSDSLEGFKNGNPSVKDIAMLLICLKAYLDLSADALILADLVQRSLIDTKKYGNNVTQLLNFNNSYYTFILDNKTKFISTTGNNGKYETALQMYFGKTFLHKKLVYSTDLANHILKNLIFAATSGYKTIFTSVMQQIQGGNYIPMTDGSSTQYLYKPTTDKKFIKKINDRIESIVRARVANNNTNLRIQDDQLQELLFGKNNISKQLNYIKNYIREHKEDPSLLTLVDDSGNIRNEMLNYLQAITTSKKNLINRISTATSSMNNSRHYDDRLISSFYDLLTNDDPVISDFAELLVRYAFVTSYDNRTPNSFFLLVPTQYKSQIGYIGAIAESIVGLNRNEVDVIGGSPDINLLGNSLHLALARNYWKDNEIVPTYVRKVKLDEEGGSSWSNTIDLSSAADKNNSNVNTVISIRDWSDVAKNHKFIKVTGSRGNNTILYQRVGSIIDLSSEKAKIKEIVYAAIPKLGLDSGANSVYELYKEGDEQSAFDTNQFTDKMIELTTEKLDDTITNYISKNKNSNLEFVKDPEYKQVEIATYVNTTWEIEELGKQESDISTEGGENSDTIKPSDFIDNTGNTEDIDETGILDDDVIDFLDDATYSDAYDDITDDSLDINAFDVVDDILNSTESFEEEIEESDSSIDVLEEEGKKRRKECE